jgi:hypothetical protein
MQINETEVQRIRKKFLEAAREAGPNPEPSKILWGWQLVQDMYLARGMRLVDPNVHSVMLDIRDGKKPDISRAIRAKMHLGVQVKGEPGHFITEELPPEDRAVLTSFIQALHNSLQLLS